jgi:hypothetical protein
MNHDNVLEITYQIIDKFELSKQKFYIIKDNEKIYVPTILIKINQSVAREHYFVQIVLTLISR